MAYRIKKKILLSAPREKVWLAYRDRLVEIGQSMPAVENISVIEREEKGQKVHLENCWKITGNLPKSVRKFMPDNLLTYTDKAIWDEKKMICYYEEEPADGSGLYLCKGQNIFEKDKENTVLTIDLELTINVKKMVGIPRLLFNTIISKIEKFISKEVAKNLVATAKLVVEFTNSNKKEDE